MREFLTNRHSVDLFIISARDRICSISILKEKVISQIQNLSKRTRIINLAYHIVQNCFGHCHIFDVNMYLKSKNVIAKCLKKIASSHWKWKSEIALVLWCAASGLKLEVRSLISIKNCFCE